jgi:hypothetical protein
MAGKGKKTFVAGEVLLAQDVNDYLMDQTVMNFATSAARASAIPTPTEGMTSYISTTGTATIPQIETYTGSEWQTPYGLTQVANVSFTSATTVTVDNVFTSAYENYIIVCNLTSASTFNVTMQMRAGGVSTGGSAYNNSSLFLGYSGAPAVTPSNSASASSFTEVARLNSDNAYFVMKILQPQASGVKTFMHSENLDTIIFRTTGGFVNATTQFDGFQLAGGTVTGTLRVYGLRNS